MFKSIVFKCIYTSFISEVLHTTIRKLWLTQRFIVHKAIDLNTYPKVCKKSLRLIKREHKLFENI